MKFVVILSLSNKSEKIKVTDSMIAEAKSEITLLRQMVGNKNVSVADALTKLADLYCRRKMYKEMEPLLIEALQIREDAFGDEHHTVSTELKNLARVYMAQERYAVAEPLLSPFRDRPSLSPQHLFDDDEDLLPADSVPQGNEEEELEAEYEEDYEDEDTHENTPGMDSSISLHYAHAFCL